MTNPTLESCARASYQVRAKALGMHDWEERPQRVRLIEIQGMREALKLLMEPDESVVDLLEDFIHKHYDWSAAPAVLAWQAAFRHILEEADE